MSRTLYVLLLWAVSISSNAQSKSGTAKTTNAVSAIKEADIKRDLFALAGDHFRGREGGSLDELKASVWNCRPTPGHGSATGGR